MLDTNGLITIDKHVQLKPYIAREPKEYQLMTDDEIWKGAGGTLIVDTESFLNLFLIAFKCIRTNKLIRLTYPIDPFKLSWIMQSYRTVGFYSIKYDIPMIWAAKAGLVPPVLQEISSQLINDIKIKDIVEEYKFTIFQTNHIDLTDVCPLKGSLKLYGARIHSPRIQDLPFSVTTPLREEQIPIVLDYNINDLDETHRLFNFMQDRIALREAMSLDYREDLRSKSDAQIAETVINKEIYKATGRWPKRPIIEPGTRFKYSVPHYINYQSPVLQKALEKVKAAEFVVGNYGIGMPAELSDLHIQLNKSIYRMGIGGLHSFEKNVAYKSTSTMNIIDRDVASYYPAIILNQGLYPNHMGMAFLEIYKSIVERRLEAKKTGNKTADKGLKVTINGTFGKSNSIWSTIYSPQMFIQIVITGQLSLLMLIEMLEQHGMQVISANTDGVVFLCQRYLNMDMSEYEYVIKTWEQRTGFQTEETRYSAYYARDVNAYFAVKQNGEVKVKGPYSEVGSTTGTQLDINPASLICSDAVKALLGKNVPIADTIAQCRDITRFVTVRNVKGGAHKDNYYLGKVIRFYYAKNETGTINYITNNNRVPDTEGARSLMDLPDAFPNDINYQWYLDKTNEILEEINYLPKKEQLKFF